MTNLEAIKNGTNKPWNELIEGIDIEDIAEMISQNVCSSCICKDYCKERYENENYSCHRVIEGWLKEEYQLTI